MSRMTTDVAAAERIIADIAEAGKALLRLVEWKRGAPDRSCKINWEAASILDSIRVTLEWEEGAIDHFLWADSAGFVRSDRKAMTKWYTGAKPPGLPATIHAALDAAERAEEDDG